MVNLWGNPAFHIHKALSFTVFLQAIKPMASLDNFVERPLTHEAIRFWVWRNTVKLSTLWMWNPSKSHKPFISIFIYVFTHIIIIILMLIFSMLAWVEWGLARQYTTVGWSYYYKALLKRKKNSKSWREEDYLYFYSIGLQRKKNQWKHKTIGCSIKKGTRGANTITNLVNVHWSGTHTHIKWRNIAVIFSFI